MLQQSYIHLWFTAKETILRFTSYVYTYKEALH